MPDSHGACLPAEHGTSLLAVSAHRQLGQPYLNQTDFAVHLGWLGHAPRSFGLGLHSRTTSVEKTDSLPASIEGTHTSQTARRHPHRNPLRPAVGRTGTSLWDVWGLKDMRHRSPVQQRCYMVGPAASPEYCAPLPISGSVPNSVGEQAPPGNRNQNILPGHFRRTLSLTRLGPGPGSERRAAGIILGTSWNSGRQHSSFHSWLAG